MKFICQEQICKSDSLRSQHPDYLGSIRLATTPSRTMYFDTAYAPFGETYASTGTLDPSYTGQTNDVASYRQDTAGGLYDFPLREYSSQGRWPNPDPLGRSATCPKDPQTQNRYAYVRNNPMSYTDPTGGMLCEQCFDDGGGGCDLLFDPLCNPCLADPYACLPGGFIGVGGPPAETRKFPWQELPPQFFDPLEDGGGTGPIWSEQIPISAGPLNPYLIIQNFTTDTSVGDIVRLDTPISVIVWVPYAQIGPGSAPKTPWYSTCTAKAIGSALLDAGIDAIGLIPEGGIASKTVGKLVFGGAYRGKVATQQATKGIQAVKAGAGIVTTGLGAGETSTIGTLKTVAGVAGLVPVLGQGAAAASIVLDAIQGVMDVRKCY